MIINKGVLMYIEKMSDLIENYVVVYKLKVSDFEVIKIVFVIFLVKFVV